MKEENKRILFGKKITYKIVDEEGKTLQGGFRNKACADNEKHNLRRYKKEKLKVEIEKEEEMKNKKGQVQNLLFWVIAIIFLSALVLIIISITDSKNFKITKEGVQVDSLLACCIEIKNIDYFENTSMQNAGRTDTVSYYGNEIICVPDGENILGLICKEIPKEDLNEDWLEFNSEYISEFEIYKFGDYEIEKD